MAGHAQLEFVMTECSKTQIRLTGLKSCIILVHNKATYFYSPILPVFSITDIKGQKSKSSDDTDQIGDRN